MNNAEPMGKGDPVFSLAKEVVQSGHRLGPGPAVISTLCAGRFKLSDPRAVIQALE